jgi:amidohydrolase
MNLKEKIQTAAKNLLPQIIEIRRHLHQHPELSFEEHKTSAFIQKQLRDAGIEFKTGYVKTGIVALIKGKNPDKKTVLLRGDMDALPIQEKNDVPYKSVHDGIMHACGHDVHTSCILGAALILNQFKESFEGTIKIMFQPGEEVLPGGASLMIEEGVLQSPEVNKALALHVFPSMEAGKIGFRKGMYMASCDELYLTVTGKGGHAAMPADYINPLIVISEILLEINRRFMVPAALSGTKGENIPTVVAFGKIEGRGATNIIPDFVEAEGTLRTMNEDWRKEIHNALQEIATTVASRNNASAEMKIIKGYPFLVNDEKFTEGCSDAAKLFLGPENVEELPLRMTAEDFAYITQEVPSCFFRLGTANTAKGITSGVHTATFNVDEKSLEIGMAITAWLAISELNNT